jgi:Arc/MetJ-type ribon-helix-helix transcriptional regulator
VKARILIVCEGRETEPNYFRGLREEEVVRRKFNVVVKKGKGGSCSEVVQQAIDEMANAATRGEAYDEVWCVFDVEQPARFEEARAARRQATDHGIRLALSNPSFEVWLLAHFVRTKRSFASGSDVIRELNKHWQREFSRQYEKNDEQVYARLRDRTETALDNAQKVREQDWASADDILDCNSATEVYLLVDRLLNPAD